MAALNIRLVVPKPESKIIDASLNQNNVCDDVPKLTKTCYYGK